MAARERMGSTICLIVVLINLVIVANSFNIDLEKAWIYTKGKGNYFGYSIAYHKSLRSIIVGAPLSDDNNMNNGKNWGTVYKCAQEGTRECTLLNNIDTTDIKEGNKTNQWMGATVYCDSKNILACAPRTKKKSAGELYLVGRCEIVNPNLVNVKPIVWSPCDIGSGSTSNTDFNIDFCQIGFSAKQTTGQLVSGAFRDEFEGRVIVVKGDGQNLNQGAKNSGFTSGENLNFFDYMGYAVASGIFKSDKSTITAVGGAPRGDQLGGKVILYDTSQDGYPVFAEIKEPDPKQIGSYFGASLGAADINGDGFSDLVVGAPQDAHDKPNHGAFHVYMNDGNNDLTHSQTVKGTFKNGFFAYAIGSVGDLNNDEMDDIAIGEPWGGDDGKGRVYLYYGTKNKGEPLRKSQVINPKDIQPSTPFDGFGFSFAEHYPYDDTDGNKVKKNPFQYNDVDRNEYNDLIVGSYRSGHAVVLRARPIIGITAKLTTTTKFIDLYNVDPELLCEYKGEKVKCIRDLEITFTITGATDIEIEYSLELDADSPASSRGFIFMNNKEEVVYNNTVNPSINKVTTIAVYFKNNTNNLGLPFVMRLTWALKKCDASSTTKLCPILSDVPASVVKEIPYVKDCNKDGNIVCNPDLKLTMEAFDDTDEEKEKRKISLVTKGVTTSVLIEVTITNDANRENAFTNSLEIIYPLSLKAQGVKIADSKATADWEENVTQDKDYPTVRVMLRSPISPGSTEIIYVSFHIGVVQKGDSLNFTATAKTLNDVNLADNEAMTSISVGLSAEIVASLRISPEYLRWKPENTDPRIIGQTVTFTFFFQNKGPSDVKTSNIDIEIPEKFGDNYLLNINSIEISGTKGNCDVSNLNPLNLDKDGVNNTRKRRDTENERIADCGGAQCRKIKCTSSQLLAIGGTVSAQGAKVVVMATLVDATFENVIKDGLELKATAIFTSDSVDKLIGDSNRVEESLQVNSPHFTKVGESKDIEWWIILLCVLGALLIIAIIVFVLYKKGFFKRKKHGEKGENNEDDGEEEEEALRNGEPNEYY